MENTVPYLYGSPLRHPFEGGHAALNVLLVLAYYKLGMLDEAREAARSVLSYLPSDQGEEEREKARYYRCLTDCLAARKDGRSEPDIRAILGKVYPRGTLDRVIDDFGDPSRVFDRFYPRVTCWSCESCPVRRQCDYPYVEQMHKRLKERYGDNPQDQMRNARFFEAP